MEDGGVGCLSRAARYTKNAAAYAELAGNAGSPVLRDYYQRIAKEYSVWAEATKLFFWQAFILPEGRPAEPLRLGRPEAGGRVLFNCADVMRGVKPARLAWCSSSMCSIAIDAATIRLLPGGGA
jgi:hypothetical protein